jgi:hypothetical protein
VGENWFLHRGIKYNIFGLIPKTCYVTQTLNIKYRGTIEPRATAKISTPPPQCNTDQVITPPEDMTYCISNF